MKLLTKEQMELLTTQRLLAYKDVLMKVPESPDYDCDLWYDRGYNDSTLCKISPEWKDAYNTLKSILATREHVK